METSTWVSSGLTSVLIVVTIIYVWRTWEISNSSKNAARATEVLADKTADLATATSKQTDLTARMLSETRKARMDALLPILQINKVGQKGPDPDEIGGFLVNIGVGPAINVKLRLDHARFEYNESDWRVLAVGEKNNWSMDKRQGVPPSERGDSSTATLIASYQDVFGRSFASRQNLACTSASGDWNPRSFSWEEPKGEGH
ncbi:MAG: hypothetical protein ABIH46_03980 [Chloroflexota bacterium]